MADHNRRENKMKTNRPKTTTTGTKTAKIRYRVATPVTYEKNGEEVTFWQSLGTGFKNENSISIELNALPTSRKIVLFEDNGESRDVGF